MSKSQTYSKNKDFIKSSFQLKYYHFPEHIYGAQFRDEIILLDTKKDKYTICLPNVSRCIISLIQDGDNSKANTTEYDIIQNLIDKRIIVEKENIYPYFIDFKPDAEGASNVDWKLPFKAKSCGLNKEAIEPLALLIKVNLYMKLWGFYSTIKLLKTTCLNEKNYVIPSSEELIDLAKAVNNACLYYPNRVKCLEWALTYVLLALKRKWKCNLEVGVQNYPFYAHAWVECDGKVIMDSQDLRQNLAIILNEPFRKLRK